jgi:hypothetical protein
MGALGLGDDRGRAIGCGDLAGVTARPRGGQMRQRPAASTPCVTPAGARRRQVTIGTVRAAEQAAAPVVDGTAALAGHLAAIKQALDGPDAHLWRMALMPCAARIAELTSELRRLVSGVSL